MQNDVMPASFESRIADQPRTFDAARGDRTLEALGARAGNGALRTLIRATASNSPHLAREIEREADFVETLTRDSAEIGRAHV